MRAHRREKSVVCLFYKAMFITSIVFKMSNMMLKQVNKRNLIKVNNLLQNNFIEN